MIRKELQRLKINEDVEKFSKDIKHDLMDGANESQDEKESPAVLKLIDVILKTAIGSKASDIHIEATEKNCLMRYRIDGMLHEFRIGEDYFWPLDSRLKNFLILNFRNFWAGGKEEKTNKGMG